MLFGLLKRKFFAVEERDEDVTPSTSINNSVACRPRKRLRVAKPASIPEADTIHSQNAGAAGQEEEKQQEARNDNLSVKLKEIEETIVAIKKEAEPDVTMLQELTEETMVCMICRDMIQNPQLLQCGHTACYSCLRSWWTQPFPDEVVPMIDTVAESDLEDDNVAMEADHAEPDVAAPPRARRRHVFPSAVKREKFCPYCNEQMTCRPIPDLRTRDIVETLNRDLRPVPPHIQARRAARLTRRRDLWHGIFYGDDEVVPANRPAIPVAPVGPPPPHPDPILNHIAQAQFRRAQEEFGARRRNARDAAYDTGRRLGIWETTMKLDREEARRAAMPRPAHELAFGGGHPAPPPLAGAVVGAIPGVPLLVVVPRAAARDPPAATNGQPM